RWTKSRFGESFVCASREDLMRTQVPLTAFAASLAIAVLAPTAQAQPPATPPAAAALAIKPVKPGLYIVTGAGGNVTVRVTTEGLVVVDTKNNGQAIFDDLMSRIRSVSDQPVKFVIDTHHHADHTGNNARFLAAGATVIGH